MRHLIVTLAALLAFGLAVSEANAVKLFGWEFNTDGEGPDIVTDEVPGSVWSNHNDYVPEAGNNDVAGGVHRFITGPPSGNYYAYRKYDMEGPYDYLEVQARMKVYQPAHGNHVGMRFYNEGVAHRAQFAISATQVRLNEEGPAADIVADDDFHVYRFVWDRTAPSGERNKLYMDDELLLQSNPQDRGPFDFTGFEYHDFTSDGYADWETDWIRVYDAPPSGGPIPGDANGDGCVTDADAAILATNWQQSDMGWSDGDFSGDGSVTDADAAILATHWQECEPQEAAAVPEPGTIVLLAGGLLGLLVWRRRRL